MRRDLSVPLKRPTHVVMTGDAVGGIWTYSLGLAAGLGRAGVKTTLVLAGPHPSCDQLRAAEAVAGLTLVITDAPLDWTAADDSALARAAVTVADIAGLNGADIVHLNSPALAAYAPFGAPVLGVCHSCLATWWRDVKGTAPQREIAWRIRATAAGYGVCDSLVAPSRAFAEATAATYHVPPPRVVHNGCAALERNSPPVPTCRVLTAGRLWDEGKDVRTLDRAAARIVAPVVALGPLAAPDDSRVAFAHLDTPGAVDAATVAAWMARAEVFASAARYEPFGLAVLEAARAGLPLVLSDIPTFRELWQDAAVFVRAGDAEGFAAAITALLDSPEDRVRAGAAAQRCAKRYDLATMTGGYLDLYERLYALGGRT